MAADQAHRDVEFKTFDGLTLRGWLFEGPKGGAAVIVNGAFMCPKEIFATSIAAWFGRNGVTALVYDARSLGTSDGMPRSDLDPQKMAEDNSDAVTFLLKEGWVDPNRIAVWGFFYSSGIALEAAAFDKRIKAVIAQGLMPEWYLDPVDQEALVARAVADRASQLSGNPPEYVPLLNDKGEHFIFFKYLAIMTPEQQAHLPNWVHGARKNAPTFRDSLTIQSFYRHAKWQPIHLFASVSPTPVMILTPENDEVVPPEYQKSIFDSLKSPQKKFQIVKNRGHQDFLSVDLDELLAGQLAFLKEVLNF
ncbi:alpha/beta-hydrolase [Xylaria venustula]|nr:alpha/beta-hydrolase [Xylaria venustula]